MPAGCDFNCRNEKCKYYGTGFVITAPWPLGKIDELIESNGIKGLPAQELWKSLKESGREYACITYPNTNELETHAHRINLWGKESKCVWQYDIIKNDDETLEEAIERADLPKECPKSGSKMMNYNAVIKHGIDCPECSHKLNQNRWFTKEI